MFSAKTKIFLIFLGLSVINSMNMLANADQNKRIVGSLNGAPSKLDPAEIVDSAQWHTLLNLGVCLVKHDAVGNLVGEAAKSWTVSSDFREYSFELVEGLLDSEGKALTSEDWKATFSHLLKSGGSTHSFISQFLTDAGIETPSPNKLILKLNAPYQTFLQRLTTPEFILLPRKAISATGAADLHVSSGAYRLEEFNVKEGRCTLRANKFFRAYSVDQPQEVVLASAPPNTKDVLQKIKSGDWNFSIVTLLPTDPNAENFSHAIESGEIRSISTNPSAVAFVLLLPSKRLSSLDQRIALSKLLSEKATAELGHFSAKPAVQLYPPGFVGALNPVRANEIKSEIAAKGGAKNLPQKLIGYGSTGGMLYGVPQWVQKKLESVGIAVETKQTSYTEYQAKQSTLDHDYVVVITGMNSKDPAGSLLTLLSPKSGIIPDADRSLNGLLQQAVQAAPAERAAFLHKVSENLLLSATIVPLMHFGTSIVSSGNLKAILPSQYEDEIRLADIRWK